MKAVELKAIAKDMGIKNWWLLNKADLITAIEHKDINKEPTAQNNKEELEMDNTSVFEKEELARKKEEEKAAKLAEKEAKKAEKAAEKARKAAEREAKKAAKAEKSIKTQIVIAAFGEEKKVFLTHLPIKQVYATVSAAGGKGAFVTPFAKIEAHKALNEGDTPVFNDTYAKKADEIIAVMGETTPELLEDNYTVAEVVKTVKSEDTIEENTEA